MQTQGIEAFSQTTRTLKSQAIKSNAERSAALEEILSRHGSGGSSNAGRISFKQQLESEQIPLGREIFQPINGAGITGFREVTGTGRDTPLRSATLEEEQKASLEEILSHYNSSEFSFSDKVSLREELQANQIPLGRETFQIMHDAGFSRPDQVTGTDGATETDEVAETESDSPLRSATLTDEQKTALEQILAQYNPEDFSFSDKVSLTEELAAAQIPLGRETFQIMHDAGFSRPDQVTGTDEAAGTDEVAETETDSPLRSATLTDEQKAALEQILAQYNAESFSFSDKVSLTEELAAAQIPLGRETFQIMHDAGFPRPDQVTGTDEAAGTDEVAETETDSPLQSATLTDEQKAALEQILAQYNAEDFSFSDQVSLRGELEAAQIPLGRETFQVLYDAGYTKPEEVIGAGEGLSGTEPTEAGLNVGPMRDLLQQLRAFQTSGNEFASQFAQVTQTINSLLGTLVKTTA